MTIREIWRDYKYNLEDSDITMLNNELQGILPFDDGKDFMELFNRHIHYMDCTRTIPNGMRIIQTINESYKWELARCVYLANWYKEYDVNIYENCINKIIERHKANLEFEITTPPIVYDKLKTKKTTTRKRKAKEGDMFPEETAKSKSSKAEAKLKAKLLGASISFGGFKLKPKD